MWAVTQRQQIQRFWDAEQVVATRGQVKMLDGQGCAKSTKKEADSGKGRAMCQAQERPRLRQRGREAAAQTGYRPFHSIVWVAPVH